MGPQQARLRGQQQASADNNLSASSGYYQSNPYFTPGDSFELDNSGFISQQNHSMNARQILPYPEPGALPENTMAGTSQTPRAPYDFPATSQQPHWQLPPAFESSYPPPPQLFPVDDVYTASSYPKLQTAAPEPVGATKHYRPIAPAPAPAPTRQLYHNHQVVNPVPVPHSFNRPLDGPGRLAATDEVVDLRDHSDTKEWTGKSIFPTEVYYENGRTYQAYRADAYYFPNDPQEQDRLDLEHHIWEILLGGRLYLAPIQRPANVLDIGTGTGLWAKEFAEQHPDCQVVGTDLTLMQPVIGPPHPNVSFVKEDAEEDEWTIPIGFDYVHVRGLHMAVKDHMKLLRNIYKHLAPGGWVEVQDIGLEFVSNDGSGQGSALERHCQLVRHGLTALGRDPSALDRYRAMFAEVGFLGSSLHESIVPMPCSMWPAEPRYRYAGHYSALNICQVVRSVTFKLLRAAGVTARGNQRLADEVDREVRSCRVHGYWPTHIICAQKPW